MQRNRIWAGRNYIPALGGEVDCIAFPYFRAGELVNIKFRAVAEKAFAQVKGAEQILYGLDDIAEVKSAIIVEASLAVEGSRRCNYLYLYAARKASAHAKTSLITRL